MKRLFVTIVLLFSAYAVAEAQGLGQLYDDGQVRGVVVKLAPDGSPAVLMSLTSTKEPFQESKEPLPGLSATHLSDGRMNMAAIAKYKMQHGGSFPAFEWCNSLGPGWYLPSLNELYDAWINTFGGDEALDNYHQDKMMAVRELVKQADGDKMTWDKNQPIPMIASTLDVMTNKKGKEATVLRTVGLKESTGSAIGSFAIVGSPFGRTRKGGKISTLYMVPHMGGSDGVGVFRAFYRLRDDAYDGGIYEAPEVKRGATSRIKDAPDTQLISAEAEVPTEQPAPAPTPRPQQQPRRQAAPQPQMQQQPVQQQSVQQQPAPQAAPQQVVYANNSGWDIIVAPGQDIQCRVTRVGEKEIEYKKAGFEEGPTYTISRRKAEKIIYANGTVEEVKKSPLDFLKRK